ncbi:hypothetical protein EVAR_66595_1 [Eumeta japonica]|uniref:Uncharacterized protein n=1 Tax=Eumeta variegata TaxID=151549 RepID=A0A4C1ZNP0_EUMVA|nr:hypothetical protein EVAR_66595_1 [Eumeta japonica]
MVEVDRRQEGGQKWYHFLDIVTIVSGLLYKRLGKMKQEPTPLKLKEFKFEVAKWLCMIDLSIFKKRDIRSDFIQNVTVIGSGIEIASGTRSKIESQEREQKRKLDHSQGQVRGQSYKQERDCNRNGKLYRGRG